jgi:hypothetical protein
MPRSRVEVGSHPDVSEVQDCRAGDCDQRREIAACQEQDVVEDSGWNLKLMWAIAVVPRHVRQVQQIKCGLDVVSGELLLDAEPAVLTALLAADRHGLSPRRAR